jgi:hypothetical protein
MITVRKRLPNRRGSRTIAFEKNGQRFTASYGFFADGTLAEIFLNNSKAGNDVDTSARDAAIACSFALQYGVDLDALRKALSREGGGKPIGVLGEALDRIAAERVAELPPAPGEGATQ